MIYNVGWYAGVQTVCRYRANKGVSNARFSLIFYDSAPLFFKVVNSGLSATKMVIWTVFWNKFTKPFIKFG